MGTGVSEGVRERKRNLDKGPSVRQSRINKTRSIRQRIVERTVSETSSIMRGEKSLDVTDG